MSHTSYPRPGLRHRGSVVSHILWRTRVFSFPLLTAPAWRMVHGPPHGPRRPP